MTESVPVTETVPVTESVAVVVVTYNRADTLLCGCRKCA